MLLLQLMMASEDSVAPRQLVWISTEGNTVHHSAHLTSSACCIAACPRDGWGLAVGARTQFNFTKAARHVVDVGESNHVKLFERNGLLRWTVEDILPAYVCFRLTYTCSAKSFDYWRQEKIRDVGWSADGQVLSVLGGRKCQ